MDTRWETIVNDVMLEQHPGRSLCGLIPGGYGLGISRNVIGDN